VYFPRTPWLKSYSSRIVSLSSSFFIGESFSTGGDPDAYEPNLIGALRVRNYQEASKTKATSNVRAFGRGALHPIPVGSIEKARPTCRQ